MRSGVLLFHSITLIGTSLVIESAAELLLGLAHKYSLYLNDFNKRILLYADFHPCLRVQAKSSLLLYVTSSKKFYIKITFVVGMENAETMGYIYNERINLHHPFPHSVFAHLEQCL